MLDWEVREEALPPETPTPRPPHRLRWRWLLFLVPLLLVVGGILLWQSREREEALRRDVQAAIDEEERARSFGLVDEAARFAVSDVPERWLSGYRYRFQRDAADPPLPEVEVARVELRDNDRHALVTVQAGHDQRLRSYGRTSGEWRRAPLPRSVWGSPHAVPLSGDVTLHYWDLDAAFATQLAADWPALAELMGTVPLDEIRIEPVEFRTAAYHDPERQVLQLASPQLVRYDPWLTGAEVVRYDLALKLLRAAWPVGEHAGRVSHRVIRDAVYEITALRWALSPERMDHLREAWRDQVAAPWHSPFDTTVAEATTLFAGKPAALSSQGAVTMLLADLLYARVSAYELMNEFKWSDVSLASEWWAERVLVLVGEGRYSLDARLERYVAEGYDAAIQAPTVSASSQQVTTTGTFAPQDSSSDPLLFERSEGSRSWPVSLATEEVSLPNGATLPMSCAALVEQVQITGYWQDDPLGTLRVDRVQADRIRPPDVSPLRPIPEEAVLLSLGEVSGSPTTRSDGRVGMGLDAILPDGRRHALYDNEQAIVPRRVVLDDVETYALQMQATEPCEATWLFLIDQQQRYVGPWLLAQPSTLGEWGLPHLFSIDPGHERWLLVSRPGQNEATTWLLDAGSSIAQPLDLPMAEVGTLIGWRAATQRLLFWTPPEEPPALLSLSLSGEVETLPLPHANAPVGDEFSVLYAATSEHIVFVSNEQGVMRHALETGRSEALLPSLPEESEGSRALVGLLDQERYVALFEFDPQRAPPLELLIVALDGEVLSRTPWDEISGLDFIQCPNDEVLVLQSTIHRDQSPFQLGPFTLLRLTVEAPIELMRFTAEEMPLSVACLLGE